MVLKKKNVDEKSCGDGLLLIPCSAGFQDEYFPRTQLEDGDASADKVKMLISGVAVNVIIAVIMLISKDKHAALPSS